MDGSFTRLAVLVLICINIVTGVTSNVFVDTEFNAVYGRRAGLLASIAYPGKNDVLDTEFAGFHQLLVGGPDRDQQKGYVCIDATGIMHANPIIVVSYAGTKSMDDVKADLNTLPNDDGIHKGFYKDFQQTKDQVLKHIEGFKQKLGNEDTPILLTGHSLGGAVAIVAAAELDGKLGKSLITVYTIGSPRAGREELNKRVVQSTNGRVFRIVNGKDCIPYLPPKAFGLKVTNNDLRKSLSILGKCALNSFCKTEAFGQSNGYRHVGQQINLESSEDSRSVKMSIYMDDSRDELVSDVMAAKRAFENKDTRLGMHHKSSEYMMTLDILVESKSDETKATEPIHPTKKAKKSHETKATDPTNTTKRTKNSDETKATEPTNTTKKTKKSDETKATEPTNTITKKTKKKLKKSEKAKKSLPRNPSKTETSSSIATKQSKPSKRSIPVSTSSLNMATLPITPDDESSSVGATSTMMMMTTPSFLIAAIWLM